MGKRNATEALEHSDATTPQKKQRLHDALGLMAAVTETPPQTYTLTKELVEDTVLLDLNLQKWRVGQPVGKGSFGEIFLASDDISRPVAEHNAKYVVKIEPHSNGPLFVEIHCLMNTAKHSEEAPLPDGMPEYIASGSHLFRNEKYRFLILPRFKYDLHSVLKLHHKRLDEKNLLVLACQILDILQHLHDSGYVHSDIKAENLMVANPGDVRRRRQLRDLMMASNSASTSSISSASSTMTLATKASTVKMEDAVDGPVTPSRKFASVEFSGSNPVRKCRFKSSMSHETSASYNEMVSSHYLRPLKQINYVDDSEASSDAFGGSKTDGGGTSSRPPPDVYNSNSNMSVLSSSGSTCSMASSSGISSIAQNGLGSGRGGVVGMAHAAGRRRKAATGPSSKGVSTRAAPKRGKGANSRCRIISESNAEDEEEEMGYRDSAQEQNERDRIFLIDFGLASKYVDTAGTHRPFFMDERRAHDGTLEFTSRDAHLGAHARRSDLECLGYNLICWAQGNLPWRNEKMLQQPEEVRHMKEFFMSNVKETLKLCYGPQVPKYLAVYMDYVNQLMYTDRPDYDYCRSIFRKEFTRLGHDLKTDFHLDLEPLRHGGVKLEPQQATPLAQKSVATAPAAVPSTGKEPVANGRARRTTGRRTAGRAMQEGDAVDGQKGRAESTPVVVTTPHLQCNAQLLAKFGLMVPSAKEASSKISPKNLRSKKAAPKKKRRKMSWEELLATDPEEIARQRIEKEFDEQDSNLELSVKYQGKPTYAILELENKLNNTLTGEQEEENAASESFLEVSPIKGYTKPMMDIVRRRHSNLIRILTDSQNPIQEEGEEGEEDGDEDDDEEQDADNTLTVTNGMAAKRSPMMERVLTPTLNNSNNCTTPRRKAGLRPHVKRTSKSLFYHKNLLKQKIGDVKRQDMHRKRLSSAEVEEEEESASSGDDKPLITQLRKPEKKRSSGGKKRYEEDEDWDLENAEPEIDDCNEVAEEDEDEEDEDEEEGDDEEEAPVEDSEEDEEALSSEGHSGDGEEESNSCDRDLGSKRNTRLTRWNGGGAGNGRRLHTIGASNRFTESGECVG